MLQIVYPLSHKSFGRKSILCYCAMRISTGQSLWVHLLSHMKTDRLQLQVKIPGIKALSLYYEKADKREIN
jgi:hypothetical protein